MQKLIVLCLMLLFTYVLNCDEEIKIGQPAPVIFISEFLTNPLLDSAGLMNKTIVLEFWATWCGPCVQSIPHINELVDKYASDSVIFISITNESKEKVTDFLKNKTLKSRVALDLTRQTNAAYKNKFIPQAFIINKFGYIDWIGHPATLNDSVFTQYFARMQEWDRIILYNLQNPQNQQNSIDSIKN